MSKRIAMVALGLGVLLLAALALVTGINNFAPFYAGEPQEVLATQTQEVLDESGVSPPKSPGIEEMDHRDPVDAPLRSSPEGRDRATYDAVINQFAVESNPSYKPRADHTYCNIFVWDVTRAMGAEIPRWVGKDGKPSRAWLTDQGWNIQVPTHGISANGMIRWLNKYGSRYGWHQVSAEEAQHLANLGYPAVAAAHTPNGGEGHMSIVRPGSISNGPAQAQAGPSNVNYAHVYDFFPREDTQFFANS